MNIISRELPPDLIDGITFHRTRQADRAFQDAQRQAIFRFCEAVEKEAQSFYDKHKGSNYYHEYVLSMKKLLAEL